MKSWSFFCLKIDVIKFESSSSYTILKSYMLQSYRMWRLIKGMFGFNYEYSRRGSIFPKAAHCCFNLMWIPTRHRSICIFQTHTNSFTCLLGSHFHGSCIYVQFPSPLNWPRTHAFSVTNCQYQIIVIKEKALKWLRMHHMAKWNIMDVDPLAWKLYMTVPCWNIACTFLFVHIK